MGIRDLAGPSAGSKRTVSIITAAGPHARGHSPLGCASRLLSGDSRFQNRTILPLNKLSRAPEPRAGPERRAPSAVCYPLYVRFLGIDYGQRRIGLAISDATGLLARPWKTLVRQGNASQVAAVLASEIAGLQSEPDGIEAVVLGFPRRLNGEEHDQSRAVRTMADQLRRVVTVPLHLQDERLSSREAEALLSRTEKDWRKRKLQLDAVAAAVILQDYLDSLAPARGAGDETDSEELA